MKIKKTDCYTAYHEEEIIHTFLVGERQEEVRVSQWFKNGVACDEPESEIEILERSAQLLTNEEFLELSEHLHALIEMKEHEEKTL